MKISTTIGDFKIIQTAKNRDELLILGSWSDLVSSFDSARAFMVNKDTQLFGVYLCKQECVEFITKAIQQIDFKDWDRFSLDPVTEESKYLA